MATPVAGSPLESGATLAPREVDLARESNTTFTLLGVNWRGIGLAAVALAVFLLVFPLVLDPFRLNLLGQFLCLSIVALGLDLLWGYAGILSMGQGVFFGLGAYAFGMYLKLEASNGALPDFMDWSGLTALPAFWVLFANPFFAVLAAMLVPAAAGGCLGFLLSRTRVSGVYIAIITQALAFIATILFIGQQPFTGGTNGLTNFSTLFGAPLKNPAVQANLYRLTVVVLGAAIVLSLALAKSRFGVLLIALRDNEKRVRFSGYNPTLPRTAVFALAAGLAGLGGALYVPQVGIINPDALGILLGIQIVIWVAVGGRGTLFGAVLGTLVVRSAQTAVSESFPDLWQYAIGALFILTVLLFPAGFMGVIRSAGRLKWMGNF
ncbi:MAG: urea ABC transporter permease subunit UrtC [Chloroflexi bacterium]|nr:urea ABC transporter permease subunit UrtC [Chloroflexota bacterium]